MAQRQVYLPPESILNYSRKWVRASGWNYR